MTRGFQHVNCGLTEQKRHVRDVSDRLASDMLGDSLVLTAGSTQMMNSTPNPSRQLLVYVCI